MRLQEMLDTQQRKLLEHDPGTRLASDSENLHEHRVAARRVRAYVRATRDYTDPSWQRLLVEPLRALGDVTGPVRDLDVLLEHVHQEMDALPWRHACREA
jgi:CHAD domain-containing protein